ncbi:MAG: NUDIX hydrolase [Myxococcaceae bacterium]
MPPPTTPLVTVDCIIQLSGDRIVLVRRAHPPIGWALPGGFVDVGETLHDAAIREVHEETGLAVDLSEQFFTYSDPARDPRRHTVSTVFIGWAEGAPHGGDDAAEARAFPLDALPTDLCFDHGTILSDFITYKRTGKRRKI